MHLILVYCERNDENKEVQEYHAHAQFQAAAYLEKIWNRKVRISPKKGHQFHFANRITFHKNKHKNFSLAYHMRKKNLSTLKPKNSKTNNTYP